MATEYLTVKCGVPQGSILGPLLFLLYIHDIHLSSSLLKFILFADDTNVLFSNADFNMLQDILNSELEKVSNWLMANKLTVNIKKTNYVIFKVRQKQLPTVPFNIRINNETIERKSHTKILVVYVDENLNWKEHVGIITKARFYLSMPSLRTLYFALVYPYLQYVLQKRIIRVITKSCFDAPSSPLFYEHNFLNLSIIY